MFAGFFREIRAGGVGRFGERKRRVVVSMCFSI
jgi:hypothetical protein